MLKVTFCGIKTKNPLVLASGILGVDDSILKRVSEFAGAVTTKSIGAKPKDGHNNPTVFDFGAGLINAVGLPSPGVEFAKEEFGDFRKINVPVIVSVYANSIKEYAYAAEKVLELHPSMIELNISCPNLKKNWTMFGADPISAGEVVAAVKDKVKKIPIMPKLTPNCSNIVDIGIACQDAGADALCAINTVGPGMAIDVYAKKPILHHKKGGVSGPAIKPIAVRCVYDLYDTVDIPILGVGGVMNGLDAAEMMMAGASLVGLGSAVYYYGIDAFKKISNELFEFLKENNYKNAGDLVGKAHNN